MVVDTINERKITNIADIRSAMKKPINGFHEVRFMKGSSVERMVLDAKKEPAVTKQILEHYRIPAPAFFASE